MKVKVHESMRGQEAELAAMLEDLSGPGPAPEGWYSAVELAEARGATLGSTQYRIDVLVSTGQWERRRFLGRKGRVCMHYRVKPPPSETE